MKPEFLESGFIIVVTIIFPASSDCTYVPSTCPFTWLATVAEKEMSLSTRATVEPSRILANIQSTSNNRILSIIWKKISWLRRGSFWFNTRRGRVREAYASQLDMLKAQKAIGVFAKVCKKGRTTFQRG